MTVFKSYIWMVKKNLGMVLMYFGIFIGIAIAMSIAGGKGTTAGFSAEKADIAIVDLDKSELSKQLIAFLKEKHNVEMAENDKSKLSEELYYEKRDIVLQIEEGFSEAVLEGKNGIHMTQRPGSYNGIYISQQIGQFLGNVLSYHSFGYSISESCQKVTKHKECKVTLDDVNGNGGKTPAYAYFFEFLPYLFLASLGVVLGKILVVFRKKEIKNRMMASSFSVFRQNVQILLGFLLMGSVLYFLSILIAALIYGKDMLSAANIGYYLLNSYVDMLAALEFAFIIGLLVKEEKRVDMIITPLSLGICFLCGVFVPQDVLSDPVQKAASFLPVHWYEKVNNLLIDHAKITGEVGQQVWQGIGIQVLFLFALVGISLAIVKYKQQER